MSTVVELKNPIEINGVKHKQFTCDPELITVAQFASAEAIAKRKSTSIVALAEFDYTFHFYLGAYAAIAVDPSIDITDMERVLGTDIMKFIEVGRFFTMRSEEQQESNSDEQSDSTPESSQLPSPTSTVRERSTSSEITEKQ